jgi:hypothetical protein
MLSSGSNSRWYDFGRHSVSGRVVAPSVLVPSDGVFGRFDLVALCGCHTLNVCFVLFADVLTSSVNIAKQIRCVSVCVCLPTKDLRCIRHILWCL